MPISEAYRRCPDGIYVRPQMDKYVTESRRIMRTLEELVPAVEKASVDEAYLDVAGLEHILGTPAEIGARIRSAICEQTGLTASVGIGPNRLIAKLGSEDCKPDGLKVVAESEVLDFLAPMPVSNLRGMGKQTLKKISGLKIQTIAELRAVPQATLEELVGAKAAAGFLRQAQGIGSTEIVTARQRKSISKETTFSQDVTDPERLHDVLRNLAMQVARTARRESLAGRVVTLKIRYQGFETFTRRTTLDHATNDEREMLETAWQLYNNGSLPDKPVRLIGVGISSWDDAIAPQQQDDLFAEQPQARTDKKILAAIDELQDKYGKPVLKIGVSKN